MTSTLLAIDIGNTNIVCGLFDQTCLKHHWRMPTHKELNPEQWGQQIGAILSKEGTKATGISGIMVASVVPEVNKPLTQLCEHLFQLSPGFVHHSMNLHLTYDVPNPEELGTDRIIDAAAAYYKFKTNLIVIDMGTATTIDAVLENGCFLGGVIAPGLATSASHLFANASKLPRIEIAKPGTLIGKNTRECMASGLFYGYKGLLEALINGIETETGKTMTVVMTGGLAPLFEKELSRRVYCEPFLTLEGLRLAREWNRAQV